MSDIFVCVRCLHSLERALVERFEPDWFEYKYQAFRCVSLGACDERVEECRVQHRKEVERRAKHLKKGECLLVIRDQFGAKYDSYGNMYVVVAEEGASAEWDRRQAEARDKGEEGCLVLSETRRPT